MKKILGLFVLWGAILAIASPCHAQDATYQTNVYTDNSGDRLNVKSGGSITVFSGGDLDLKSGASLYYNATKILGATTYLPVASGGTGSNTASGARDSLGFDFVTESVTGTATVATSLGTVAVCVAQIGTISAAEAYVQAVPNAGSVDISIYGTDTTTLSTTPVAIYIFAGGTP